MICTRYAGLIALSIFSVSGMADEAPKISVERFFVDSTHVKAIVKLTGSATKSYSTIGFRCAFFNKQVALDDAGNVATNVNFNAGPVYDSLLGPDKNTPVDSVKCRVTYAR